MKENEHFEDLINEIRSLPEPNYEENLNKEKQEQIHANLMKVAREQDSKKHKNVIGKRIMVGFSSLAAILFATIIYLSMEELNFNTSNTDKHPKNENQEAVIDKENEEENEQTTEEVVITFDDTQYQEIVEIYDNYQLVTEGEKVDYIDEEYGVIYYVNGFSIIQEVKSVAHWPHDWESKPTTPIAPENYQVLAAIKASIEGLGNEPAITKGSGETATQEHFEIDYPADIERKLQVLYRIKGFAGSSYEPLVNWMNSTISYFAEAKRLWGEKPEETKFLYEKGMNNVIEFMEALGSGFA